MRISNILCMLPSVWHAVLRQVISSLNIEKFSHEITIAIAENQIQNQSLKRKQARAFHITPKDLECALKYYESDLQLRNNYT